MAEQPAAAVSHLSPDEFLHLGLELASNGKSDRWKRAKNSSKIDLFKATYTAHPEALSRIWTFLQTTPFVEDRVDESTCPEQLLLVYRWLTKYASVKELHLHFGYGEVSIWLTCRTVTSKIAALHKVLVGYSF